MSRILLLILLLGTHFANAQITFPADIEAAINGTNNKAEIIKALQYFYNTGDSIKIKSVNFIVSNMPIHKSYNYYWADSLKRRLQFNEADYPSFEKAVSALDELKARVGKIHPVEVSYRDIDTIKAETIIENIELAIKSYGVKEYDENFYEFVLPYRVSVEPLENWRKLYTTKFIIESGDNANRDAALVRLQKEIKNWFANTYRIEQRKEPLPRLSALQLLGRAKGPCEDIAGVAAFIARSQGYPATVDFIPAWATASGLHFLNFIKIPTNQKTHFDVADGFISDTLSREPSKVLRNTFSKQAYTIAALLANDTAVIPNNFLRLQNYKDVTSEYWPTADVKTNLFKLKDEKVKASYLCVWNSGNWLPVWFSLIDNVNNRPSANYTNMAKGAVYLPMYYIGKKLIAASWPVVNSYSGSQIILMPDTIHKRNLVIESQAGYLILRPDKKYTLYYWNMGWVSGGTKIAETSFSKLTFNNIPSNVLMVLIPEYSAGKERPFIVDKEGKRFWY